MLNLKSIPRPADLGYPYFSLVILLINESECNSHICR
jgi:hypothetical protein